LDLRTVFKEISEQLISEFRKTSEIKHPGGKGDLREDAFRNFLSDYLPSRYAVGMGEIVTSEKLISPEIDIIIYDPLHCPVFIKSTSHSVFPIESVYGAISLKSHLDSGELESAYENIVSFKKILLREGFSLSSTPGLMIGMAAPIPVTGIVAYTTNRSLEAIANQLEKLDAQIADISLRPDFIAVIREGIVAPRDSLRGDFNNYNLPKEPNKLIELRKTGRHTLLRLYMQVLRELNSLTLRPLDLRVYYNMPRLVGQYRVGGPSRFARALTGSDNAQVSRFSKSAIDRIVRNAKPVTLRQHFINRVGQIPLGADESGWDLESIVYEFNPNNLPPISSDVVEIGADGRPRLKSGAFAPMSFTIDGKSYAIDPGALSEEDFEDDADFTVDELMSM
jgi:hypothetical protein